MGESKESSGVFTRNATGLVREISPHQAFIYNFMAIGLCTFTWVTLFSLAYSGNFLGSNVGLAIVLMALAAIPFYICTSMLSTAMPRSGGDYVWQSRVLHPSIAFASTLSAWTVWQWYFAGFLGSNITTIGLQPLFALLGRTSNTYASISSALGENGGSNIFTFAITTVIILLGFLIASLGMKFYVRLQYLLLAGSAISALSILGVLATTSHQGFIQSFNALTGPLIGANGTLSNQVSLAGGYYNYIINTASVGTPSLSLWNTLLLFGVIWISFGYAFWSIYNLSEIKKASSLRTQAWIQVGSSILFAIFLLGLWYLLENVVGIKFLESFYTLYSNSNPGLNPIALFYTPYYPALIASISSSPLIWVLILGGLSFGLFQVILIVYFASTRILLAASIDRVLPEKVAYVHPKRHSPLVALTISAIGCEAFLYLIIFQSSYLSYFSTAGLATQIAYVLISITAILFPFRKRQVFNSSPAGKYKIGRLPVLSLLGGVSLVVNLFIAWIYVAGPPIGFLSFYATSSIELIIGIFVACFVIYLLSWAIRRGERIDLSLAFREIPPE
jgi:APA family basic amino acid/polyamine antiporter